MATVGRVAAQGRSKVVDVTLVAICRWRFASRRTPECGSEGRRSRLCSTLGTEVSWIARARCRRLHVASRPARSGRWSVPSTLRGDWWLDSVRSWHGRQREGATLSRGAVSEATWDHGHECAASVAHRRTSASVPQDPVLAPTW